MNESGCSNNVHISNELLNISKKKTGLTLVQVDTEKDFDTIPHDIIADSLRRKGISETMITLITSSYNDIQTNI
jgi:hypothetical protein